MLFQFVPISVILIGSPQHSGIPVQPLHFIENCGQWDPSVVFAARSRHFAVRIERHAVSLTATSQASVRLCFEGGRDDVFLDPRDRAHTAYSFFLGREAERWRGGVPAHRQVRAVGLYDGVDVEYREAAERGLLEYDLHLDDPGHLDRIVVRCEGSIGLQIEPDGALRILTERGGLRQSPPRTWQVNAQGEEQPVECRYRIIDGERFGFAASVFDPFLPMVIDPAVEMFSFVGTAGTDRTIAIARGADEDVYAAGMTDDALSFTVPSENCATVAGEPSGGRNALVARFSASGDLQAVAVLGGMQDDEATALHIDPMFGVSVCGYTSSLDFPATNGSVYRGGAGFLVPGDGFVARLSPDLCSLSFSTFLGGGQSDGSQAIGVNSQGQIAVLGFTASGDFPATRGAYQRTYQGGAYDATFSLLDPTRGPARDDQLVYSTFFGGVDSDAWSGRTNPENDLTINLGLGGLAIDAEGRVAISGLTRSPNFPTTEDAFQVGVAGGVDAWTAILVPDADLPAEEQLVWSTLIGGVNFDAPFGLALGPDGGVWIAGQTTGAFPTTANAFQSGVGGASDGFVSQFNPTLKGKEQLLYSTSMGGGQWEYFNDISVSASGIAALVGDCDSSSFPPHTKGSLQETFAGAWDAFLLLLDPTLKPSDQLLYTTFVGGASIESAWAVYFDGSTAWLTGETWSFEFSPFPGETSSGGRDGYVLALDLRLPEAAFTVTGPDEGGRFSFNASASKPFPGTTIADYAWDFGDGVTAGGVQTEHIYGTPGRYSVTLCVTSDGGLVARAEKTVGVHCPSGPIDPWTAVDVGSPAFAGGSDREGAAEDSCLEICAGGDDLLSGPSDQFHFVHREFAGDAVLTARIDGFSGGAGAAVGLMFRNDLSATAAHTSILLVNSSGGKYWFLRREQDGQSTKPPTRTAGTFTLPAWIRLERKGGMITGSYSEVDPPAGADWKVLQTIPDLLPPEQPILAGIAANGKDPGPGSPFVALRTTVCLQESAPPAPRFLRGDCNGDRVADLSDAVFILGWLFLGGAKPVCVAATNTNGDGAADISDATYLLSHLFLGGPAPPEPFPDCGPGSSPEDLQLGCEDDCR